MGKYKIVLVLSEAVLVLVLGDRNHNRSKKWEVGIKKSRSIRIFNTQQGTLNNRGKSYLDYCILLVKY